MIPVRVPVDAPTYQAGGERTLQPNNPMYGTLCPVCDEFLLDGPVVLVYVGMVPTDQYRPRFCTGAAVVIHAACGAPGAQIEGAPWVHRYTSTACEHALHEGRPELHAECRLSCKYAPDGIESCRCSCHIEGAPAELPLPWVDQARDVAIRLLAVVREHGINLGRAEPDLNEAILYDPNMFWLRGEVQAAGEWHRSNNNEETPND